MTHAPQKFRTCNLAGSQETETLQTLTREFSVKDASRVKRCHRGLNRRNARFVFSEIAERGVNKDIFERSFYADAPQGEF